MEGALDGERDRMNKKTKRNKEIKKLKKQGWTYKQLSEKYDISTRRIKVIISGKKKLQDPKARAKRVREIRLSIIEKLGNKCAKCGFSDIRALQIDHIKGDGAKERKEAGGSVGIYYRIIKLSDKQMKSKYQILCANCNWIKRYGGF